MDIRSTTVRNDLSVLNGRIRADISDPGLYDAFFRSKFWSKEEGKKGTFYCFMNNTTLHYFNTKKDQIKNNFNISSDVLSFLKKGPIDYSGLKETVFEMENLDGIKLYPYQEHSVGLMLKHHYKWLILGQGTGKTFIALSYIKTVMKNEGPKTIVVVTKKNVIPQYSEEIKQHLPGVALKRFTAEKKQVGEIDGPTVIITNYEQVVNLPDIDIHSVIFDESHLLNGFTSNINKSVSKFLERVPNGYFLTGTPRDRNRDEIISQFKTALPFLAPTKTHFMDRYFFLDDHAKPVSEKRPSELEEIIDNLTFGDTSEALLGDELPKAEHIIVNCELKDRRYYNELTKNKSLILEPDTLKLIRASKINKLAKTDIEALDKLLSESYVIDAPNDGSVRSKQRQLCNGFIYYTDDDGVKHPLKMENPKYEPMKELLDSLDHGLIFTQFVPDIDVLECILQELNKNYVCIRNEMSDTNKDREIKAFQNGEYDFMVIQNRSGGTGLHVVNTNNIVYYALPESHLLYDQALYRTRRKGQLKDTCYFYSLVTTKTVEDQKILCNLKIKGYNNSQEFTIYRRRDDS